MKLSPDLTLGAADLLCRTRGAHVIYKGEDGFHLITPTHTRAATTLSRQSEEELLSVTPATALERELQHRLGDHNEP